MDYQIIQPAGILSTVVDYYWIAEDMENRSVHRQLVYPQTSHQLMVYYGSRFVTRTERMDAPEPLPGSYLCGLTTKFSELESSGGFGVLGVVFHPGSANRIAGFPLCEISGGHVSLCDWLGKAGSELEERICTARKTSNRIGILEAFLLGRLTDLSLDHRRISATLSILKASPTRYSSLKLTDAACLSERQMLRLFTRDVGISPKQFHRIVRLNHAIHLLQSYPHNAMTSLALDAGYYDQAHFNTEFREMTGFTPRRFRQLDQACREIEYPVSSR